MDGVGTPIIGRPRPLPGHDTPNPAYHPHTLNYEEPVIAADQTLSHLPTPYFLICRHWSAPHPTRRLISTPCQKESAPSHR